MEMAVDFPVPEINKTILFANSILVFRVQRGEYAS